VLGGQALSQVWGQFALEQIEEIVLIAANLHKDKVVEARVDKFADGFEMALHRRPPQLNLSATTSALRYWLAAANALLSGNSAWTGQPVSAQRK